MKKTYRLFSMICMAGAMAFLASSCKKNETTESFQVVLPEFEEVMVEPIDGAKAYIDFENGGAFKWQDGDEVMIYNIDNTGQKTRKAIYTAPAGSEGKSRVRLISGQGAVLGDRMDHFFTFYPVNRIATPLDSNLGGENREYFNVPWAQHYTLYTNPNNSADKRVTVDHAAMAMAAETNAVEQDILLNHIFGVLRLVVTADGSKVSSVDSIQVIDKSFNLNGRVSMKLHMVNMQKFQQLMGLYTWGGTHVSSEFVHAWVPYSQQLGYVAETVEEPVGGPGYVTSLVCDTPVDIATNAPLTDPHPFLGTYSNFYISVRPGALMNGFTLKIYTDNNPNPIVIDRFENPTDASMNDAYCIKAGVINFFGIAQPLDQWRD